MPHQLNLTREQQEEKMKGVIIYLLFTYHIFSPYHFGTDGKQNLIQINCQSSQNHERRKGRGDMRSGGETVTVSKQLLHSAHVLSDSSVWIIKNT